MEPESLESLFARFSDHGDAAAFARVFDRAAPALLAVARRIGQRRADADDLVQATFLTAIERASAFDPSRSLMAWLVGILAGHAKNAARRKAREQGRPAPEIARDPHLLEGLVDLERRAAVAGAIRDLPDPYRREVLSRLASMDRWDRWDRWDRGDRAGVGESALRMRLHRAVQRLRRLLPPSLLGILFASALDRRALAAVRRRVVGRLAAPPLGKSAASLSSVSIGGLVVGTSLKKFAALGVVVALLLAVRFAWTSNRSELTSPTNVQLDEPKVEVGTAPDSGPSRAAIAASPLDGVARPVALHLGPRAVGRILDAETGSPIANAACFPCAPDIDPFAIPADAARSDSSGRFTIENAHFPMQLRIESDDYAVWWRSVDTPSKGIDRDGSNLGDIELVRGATIRGRVTDASGAPVAGAKMFLHAHPMSYPKFFLDQARPVGESNADGSYSIPHVVPSGGFKWQIYAISSRGCGALSLDVLADARRVIDEDIQLAPPGTIEVDVVDETGKPVEGATVDALPIRDPYVAFDWSLEEVLKRGDRPVRALWLAPGRERVATFRVRTDPRGHAEFHALPAGFPHAIVVAKDGYFRWYVDAVESTTTPVHERAVLRTLRLFAIRGRVEDEEGKPVAGVVVHRYSQRVFEKANEGEATTDATGRFLLDGVEGEVATALHLEAEGISARPIEVTVPADRDLDGVVLVARRATPVSGIVVDDSGAPVENASVILHRPRTDEWVAMDRPRTESDGSFRFPNATAGEWAMQVDLPGEHSWVARSLDLVVHGGDASVRVVGQRIRDSAAKVELEILDGATDTPLEAKAAYYGDRPALPGSPRSLTSADERGVGFARFSSVQAGAKRARVDCDGYPSTCVDFDVAPTDKLVRVRVVMQHGTNIRGRIVAGEGVDAATLQAALASGNVRCLRLDGIDEPDAKPAWNPLRGKAEFAFESVPLGALVLAFESEVLLGQRDIEVRAGGENVFEIVAQAPGSLRVLGADQYPTGTLEVRLTREGGGAKWIGFGTAERKSTSDAVPLAPGIWNWTLTRASRGASPDVDTTQSGRIVVRAGNTVDLALPTPR